MSNLKNIQRRISEGMSSWLLFEFNCERGYLFSEKYLTYPIGQVLNSIEGFKTKAEQNHPCSNGGKGRPLQVDFILTDKNKVWKYAFESKWVGTSIIDITSLVWDLIRLQNLFTNHPAIKCYFILAGFEKKIQILFPNLIFKSNSKQQNSFIESNPTYLTFNLFKLDKTIKAKINDLILKYPLMILHSKIKCKAAHKFPKQDLINMSFSTYVFEILTPDKKQKIKNL
jgi:hypothetical protein